jgi:hypothetical protein
VEIKRGSNEIKELAAVIDRQVGWRFELIALGTGPQDVDVPSEEKLERLMARGLALREAGSDEVARERSRSDREWRRYCSVDCGVPGPAGGYEP